MFRFGFNASLPRAERDKSRPYADALRLIHIYRGMISVFINGMALAVGAWFITFRLNNHVIIYLAPLCPTFANTTANDCGLATL